MRSQDVLADKYRLIERLGEGGFGEVWQAQNVDSGQLVALKILKNEVDDPKLADLRNEAWMLARLKHQGITIIHDFVKTGDGLCFIVMEYLRGRDLRQVLDDTSDRLPEIDVLSMALQVAEALSAAHESGVVHRDLKPANLFLVNGKKVKICDFGIAVAVSGQRGSPQVSDYLIGTPEYMSPEQCEGAEVDERSDLYSLGCVIYELLTGQPPFDSANRLEIIDMHKEKQPVSPKRLRSDISADLDQLVLQLLAKDKAARPADAGALALTLKRLYQREEAARPKRFTAVLRLSDLLDNPDYLVLLGLLAVANDGLRLREIEHLSRLERLRSDQIQDIFQRADSGIFAWAGEPGDEAVIYRLASEIRRSEVVRMLGDGEMRGFRDRLHEWADECRRNGWPPTTPTCLLGSYARMLSDTDDVERLLTCAADAARHDRMFRIQGGDADALTEIDAALDALLQRKDPDLRRMAEIAVHRDELVERDNAIPADLPAVWLVLGRTDRANELIRCIADPVRREVAVARLAAVQARSPTAGAPGAAPGDGASDYRTELDPARRAQVLTSRACACAAAGQSESASVLAKKAEDAVCSVPGTGRDHDLTELAFSLALAGYRAEAERVCSRIKTQSAKSRARAVVNFATTVIRYDRARSPSAERAAEIAVACFEAGYEAEADIAATLSLSTYRALAAPGSLPVITGKLAPHFRWAAIHVVAAGHVTVRRAADADHAKLLKSYVHSAMSHLFQSRLHVKRPGWSRAEQAFSKLALLNAGAGHYLFAELFIRRIKRPDLKAHIAADVALAGAVRGRVSKALKLSAAISDVDLRARSLTDIAIALAAAERVEAAMTQIVLPMTGPQAKDQLLTQIAVSCAIDGEPRTGVAVAARINDLRAKSLALAAIITKMPETAHADNMKPSGKALSNVLSEMGKTVPRPEYMLTEPAHYAQVATALTRAGRLDAASCIAAELQAFAQSLPRGVEQVRALTIAATTLLALPTPQSAANRQQARALVALALKNGPCHLSFRALSAIDPETLIYLEALPGGATAR